MKEEIFLARDKCDLKTKMRECELIDLDKIYGLQETKHADLLLNCGELVIIIEETSTMRSADVTQIISTIDNLMKDKEKYGIRTDPKKYIGIVHSNSRVDSIGIKFLHSKTKGKMILNIANCCDDLPKKIRKYFSK
ncbi:hypothetical protein [Acidianus ambivalens]|uniref:Uncharacterized protein n=1 Tax=Acidianus ambivalens TaxID=2283 RepID=A0A650CU89_ACIAM|nr:hypothetical protein [Acidianus ambivalens]MQL56081.1 hypothetical protein [Acidianus ambivalens]QGR21368.1 hypothetical protein D1866_04720 [Acidianus ambivalens]